jgi:hypothetical protein
LGLDRLYAIKEDKVPDEFVKQIPVRARYAPVKKIGRKFCAILEKEARSSSNNDVYLISLLIKSPTKVRVGTYVRQGRLVRLPKKTCWCYSVRKDGLKVRGRVETKEIPEISMGSAVMYLQKRLKELGTPYRVWSECRDGNPKVKKKGSRFCLKSEAPFLIGLVDTRVPAKKGGV